MACVALWRRAPPRLPPGDARPPPCRQPADSRQPTECGEYIRERCCRLARTHISRQQNKTPVRSDQPRKQPTPGGCPARGTSQHHRACGAAARAVRGLSEPPMRRPLRSAASTASCQLTGCVTAGAWCGASHAPSAAAAGPSRGRCVRSLALQIRGSPEAVPVRTTVTGRVRADWVPQLLVGLIGRPHRRASWPCSASLSCCRESRGCAVDGASHGWISRARLCPPPATRAGSAASGSAAADQAHSPQQLCLQLA